jgi:hypothetical protein
MRGTWSCCAECGRELPERGFCSEECWRVFELEAPFWDALAAGASQTAARSLLPAQSPTATVLELADSLKRRWHGRLQ